MYKKSYLLLMLSCVSVSVNAMVEQPDAREKRPLVEQVNEPDERGTRPLHNIVITQKEKVELYPSALAATFSPEEYDTKHAQMGALLIYAGADVNAKNGAGVTVCEMAEKNKATLPNVYKVIMAGSVVARADEMMKEELEESASAFTNLRSRVGIKEELKASTPKIGEEEFMDYWAAVKTLDEYIKSCQSRNK